MEIKLSNIVYNYKNKKLLDRLNLTIESNKITGIIGEYKTLLCEIIAGLKDYDNGDVEIGNLYLNKHNLKRIRKEVALIKQNYEDQFFTNDIKEEIAFLFSRLSYKPKDIDKKVNQALTMVGLNEKVLDTKISDLTSGEKRLVQIAISIIYNPDIIIFDDIFTELDRNSKKKIFKFINLLKDKYNKTVIIVSNDVNLLYEITDNIVILNKGHVLTTGKTDSVYQDINVLKSNKIDMPDLVKFTLLAKSKKVKLSFHKDIRDLIKDVYKHV